MSSAPTALSTQQNTGGFNESAFNAFSKGRDEPEWLRSRRREAFEQFVAAAWPTLRDEEWRRTDIRALKLSTFGPPPAHEPSKEAKAALAHSWETLSSHY